MKKITKILLGAALPVLWASGCSDFLKGGNLKTNPNTPVTGSATPKQLFVSIQTNMIVYHESEMGRDISQWMQQLYGAARQQIGVYDYSGVDNSTDDGEFQRPYGGGGLLDLRTLEANVAAKGDVMFLGTAQVMEAWMMGYTADAWGDIPYTQAVQVYTFLTPKLDAQQEVYDSVESLLTQAITNITAATTFGPDTADLAYGSIFLSAGTYAAHFAIQKTAWLQLAHTLKARFYMHQAEKLGNGMYTNALAEATLGISSNDGDYLAFHDGNLQLSSNNWWQFMASAGGTGRALDLVGSTGAVNSTLWNMLSGSGDPRFAEYFDATNTGDGGMNSTRLGPGFPQPMVTYNENLLIIAEANLALGNGAAATTAYNTEVAAWGSATPWHSAITLPAVGGTVTLAEVMLEKYVTLFQNPEVWNDWKRTCLPVLVVVPPGTSVFGGGKVPARMWYGASEEQTNPNIPAQGTAPNGDTNWNDPVRCP